MFRSPCIRLLFALAVVLTMLPVGAAAQSVQATLSSNDTHEGFAHLVNRFDFTVKVANVQVTFVSQTGQEVRLDNAVPLNIDLLPGGEADVAISLVGGEGYRLQDATRVTVAAGVEINTIAAPAEAALASGEDQQLRDALPELDRYIPTVSLAARLHGDALARDPAIRSTFFDLERLDALKMQIEEGICGNASQRIIDAGNNRTNIYEDIGEGLRTVGLHVNCMTSEAKLAMARSLIEGDRPQDALLFRGTDSEGNLLPEWRPIILEASLAFAQKAVELGASQFSTLRPALEALNDAHQIAPEDPRVVAIADALIPAVGGWAVRACEPVGRDLDGVQAALTLLRPTWDRYPAVLEAAGALATVLIESGTTYCNNRQFTNARNEFIRGERVLDGIPAWDERADEINHCRALGALQEGRETAAIATDPGAPGRGLEKLEEALGRYELSEEEINTFKADISNAWVGVANVQREERSWNGMLHSLGEALEVSPTGMTDTIREAWLVYAESILQSKGMAMNQGDIDAVRAALDLVEGYAPERISAARSQLTFAIYGLRAGIPLAAVLLGLIAAGYAVWSRARARKMAAMVDADL
jgi:hypothetical protein